MKIFNITKKDLIPIYENVNSYYNKAIIKYQVPQSTDYWIKISIGNGLNIVDYDINIKYTDENVNTDDSSSNMENPFSNLEDVIPGFPILYLGLFIIPIICLIAIETKRH